ncbi:hypothetical protein K438DRAFT_1777621 [Mycena galopus ATCC 62051]|nr:hypothetical protein K438DRAFT_1777621 [Mycena galopus ATCC 62051]
MLTVVRQYWAKIGEESWPIASGINQTISPPLQSSSCASMEAFHKADWVSQGKKWQNVPPLVKQDICDVGLFNLLHASLTSPEALAVLRDLPNKNPALHQELTAARVMPGNTEVEELPFPSDDQMPYDDESDVPLEVLINHVEAGNSPKLPDGFAVDEAGNLARDGMVEDTELDIVANDLPLAVRCWKRSTKALNPYGGKDMWEE